MTLQQLQARIKSASDKMRADDNTKNALKYLEQLTWLLFLKVFDEMESERLLAADIDGRRYERVVPEHLAWSSWTRKGLTGDELIEFVLDDLLPGLRELDGTGQRHTISELFQSVTTVMKSGHSLAEVIAIVDTIDIRSTEDHHAMSVIYETLLAQTADAGWSGEFYTPRPVVEFIVDVVSPQLGETVYDPCCGSAGFLVAAIEFLRTQVEVGSDEARLATETVYGQEAGELAYFVGTMNLVLHGVTEPKTVRVNTLEQNVMNVGPQDQHDLILTNPPFGGNENPQVQQNFSSRAAATELLFLQHCMSKLKPGGRCAIVVPDGILYRNITAYNTVRRRLLNDFRITSILRLPLGVFPTAADTRTNILFFERTGSTSEIRYFQLHAPKGKRSYSKTNPVKPADLNRAREWLLDGKASEDAWVVSREEVELKGHLDFPWPGRSEDAGSDEASERFADLQQELATLDQMLSDLASTADDPGSLKLSQWRPLGEYVEEAGARAGDQTPSVFLGVSNTGGLGPFKGSPGADTSRYRRVAVGDFVYNPMRVDVGSIALCRRAEESGWVSPDYVAFRLIENAPFTAEYLLTFLKSAGGKAEIARQSRGAVRRRLYFDDLLKVSVPVPESPDDWEAVVASMNSLRAQARSLQRYAAVATDALEQALFNPEPTPLLAEEALPDNLAVSN